jgi:hypothetical protein
VVCGGSERRYLRPDSCPAAGAGKGLRRQLLSYVKEIKPIRRSLSHRGTSDIDALDALRAVDVP